MLPHRIPEICLKCLAHEQILPQQYYVGEVHFDGFIDWQEFPMPASLAHLVLMPNWQPVDDLAAVMEMERIYDPHRVMMPDGQPIGDPGAVMQIEQLANNIMGLQEYFCSSSFADIEREFAGGMAGLSEAELFGMPAVRARFIQVPDGIFCYLTIKFGVVLVIYLRWP
ncbi:hypothetical protein BC936DRAFT_137018 [Jimgerdemannia flammicorona]|uniref:Uncharacterized protein n=1 Tax=Jimgerdemannia flammicorona TaxID=994334 RepID=A0A433CY99_9FUNG|nr:hypothetical protein BC936DRAFT_137018 [Jimgerdemannia flammicorona]